MTRYRIPQGRLLHRPSLFYHRWPSSTDPRRVLSADIWELEPHQTCKELSPNPIFHHDVYVDPKSRSVLIDRSIFLRNIPSFQLHFLFDRVRYCGRLLEMVSLSRSRVCSRRMGLSLHWGTICRSLAPNLCFHRTRASEASRILLNGRIFFLELSQLLEQSSTGPCPRHFSYRAGISRHSLNFHL